MMATVSDVRWRNSHGTGTCKVCGKAKPLGTCNFMKQDDVRCIDCFFGPPDIEGMPGNFEDEEEQ